MLNILHDKKHRRIKLLKAEYSALKVISLMMICVISSCGSKQVLNKNESNTVSLALEKPQTTATSKEARTYFNESGWKIPNLSSYKKVKSEQTAKTARGEPITVTVTEYKPSAPLLTEEPFKTIGSSIKLVGIQAIRECQIKGYKFCYKVQVSPAHIDEKTGATSYLGSLFFFSYYDDDGDGRFENLIFDEITDNPKISYFQAPPHIPNWILEK